MYLSIGGYRGPTRERRDMAEIRYLSSEDVDDLATPKDFVEAVRGGYRDRGGGAPAAPRTTLVADEVPGMLTGYLAILPSIGYMGGYMYAAGFGAGDAWFATPLFDASEGRLLAVIDGAWMNPFKTGAAGAVGVDALAREDATTLGIIGAGTQARGQAYAIAAVRDLEEVRVYSPTSESRERFAEELGSRVDASVRAVNEVDSVVQGVDILVTATTATEPVFEGELLAPGTHVTAMGQYHPNRREVDDETIARSTYVPDLRERAFSDAGAFLHALAEGIVDEDHIHGELGEIVAGARPGRTREDEITFFDSGGTAIETVASAGMLYDRAIAADRGTLVDLSPASEAFVGR